MGRSTKQTSKKETARQIIASPETEEDDISPESLLGDDIKEEAKQSRSRRGARQLSDKKPKGAARFLYDKEKKSDRPITIYIERVTDVDSGKTGTYLWWHSEDSTTSGRREISRINTRTEEEFTLGYDFEIPFTKEAMLKLMKKSFVKTKWCKKDGPVRTRIDPEKLLEELNKKK